MWHVFVQSVVVTAPNRNVRPPEDLSGLGQDFCVRMRLLVEATNEPAELPAAYQPVDPCNESGVRLLRDGASPRAI